jgi:DNA-binding transcriptional ArsR family regulator
VSNRDAKKDLAAIDTVFKGIAHSTRRQILLILHFRGGIMTAGEIAERFSCRWPTISRHMKILERAQLVRIEKKGRERLYHLDRNRLSIARYWFTSFDQQ